MLEVLDLELLAAVAEVDNVTGRARRREDREIVQRELPFGEDVEDLASDIARRPDDRDPITHFLLSSLARPAYRMWPAKAIWLSSSRRPRGEPCADRSSCWACCCLACWPSWQRKTSSRRHRQCARRRRRAS